MRVLCAYADLYDDTRRALEKYAPGTEFVDVSGDDYAYWRAICERWTGEDDLLIVEQDIEIHETVIPQMAGCERDWCTFAYRLWRPDAWCFNALGCTRFSAALQRAVSPAEIEQVQVMWLVAGTEGGNVQYTPEVMGEGLGCGCGGRGSPPCWRHIDFKIADTLEGRLGHEPYATHVHTPPVTHLPVDKPELGKGERVTGFPWQLGHGARAISFPHEEPTRTYHSDSLDDRPDWWPKRPPGVIVTETATGREITSEDEAFPAAETVTGEWARQLQATDYGG
jgi:hypothetical protein